MGSRSRPGRGNKPVGTPERTVEGKLERIVVRTRGQASSSLIGVACDAPTNQPMQD
jgi:hypothetical protein